VGGAAAAACTANGQALGWQLLGSLPVFVMLPVLLLLLLLLLLVVVVLAQLLLLWMPRMTWVNPLAATGRRPWSCA
jgi:hypothetical protein